MLTEPTAKEKIEYWAQELSAAFNNEIFKGIYAQCMEQGMSPIEAEEAADEAVLHFDW